jgi:mRNA interferase MazF
MDSDEIRLGDIRYVDLPPLPGREQGGRRPALVLQDEEYGAKSPLVLAASLTSQLLASRFPGSVVIEASKENGLRVNSVVMLFQLRAVDRTRFDKRIGALSAEDLGRVFAALDKLTGRNNPRANEDGVRGL